jgi:glycosyltransferase involved in cell wall biosynthesis
MKICLVSQEYPPETALGGIGTQNWNKARAMARLGHTVHVLSCSNKASERQVQSHDGVTVHRMRPPDAYTDGVYNQPTYWIGYSWLVLQHLRRIMQSTRFDVIDFADYGAEGFAFQLDRAVDNRVPVVVQLHGPLAIFAERLGWPERNSDFLRVGSFMEEYSIKQADALMACSANIADFTSDYYGVARDRIKVVHCGVDAEAFHPRGEAGELHSPLTILYVGQLVLSKGLETVLKAVLRLIPKYPSLRLRIAGKGDPDVVRNLEAEARRAGAEGNIEFAGFLGRDEIAEAYREADVFCSPAQNEPGVANVYIEAMASGCPVVAANTGGAPEAVLDGVTGMLVPPSDSEATAAAIDRILSNPALRRELSFAARTSVDKYFAMDRYITRILETYEEAIGRILPATSDFAAP